jgi:hypothetical protein
MSTKTGGAVERDASSHLKSVLMDLIDSVRFSQNVKDAQAKAKSSEERLERQLDELEVLKTSITDSLSDVKWLDEAYKTELSKNISGFVNAAIEQVRGRLKARLKQDQEDYKNATESERLKAIKSLEAFLASNPLPIVDSVITLKHDEGAYAARARYKTEGGIQYEFSLNSAESKLFQNDFSLNAFGKEIKLPVRLNKTWLRKEPGAGFERLDQYILDKAEVSGNHMVCSFVSRESESTVDIVFSRSDQDSFVTIEYHDAKGRVDVTGEPSLSKHLDLQAVKSSMAQLLSAIGELEHSKLALTRLKMDEQDVLETLDCYGFMLKVIEILKPEFESWKGAPVDNALLKERLRLLGEKARPVLRALGLSEAILAEAKWQTEGME